MQAEGGETRSRNGVSWVLEETNTEREVVIDIKCTQEYKVKDRVEAGGRGLGCADPSESAGALLEEFWLDGKPKAWRVTGTEGMEMVRFGTGNRFWSRFPGTEEMSKEERDLVCEGVEPLNTAEALVRLSRVFGD